MEKHTGNITFANPGGKLLAEWYLLIVLNMHRLAYVCHMFLTIHQPAVKYISPASIRAEPWNKTGAQRSWARNHKAKCQVLGATCSSCDRLAQFTPPSPVLIFVPQTHLRFTSLLNLSRGINVKDHCLLFFSLCFSFWGSIWVSRRNVLTVFWGRSPPSDQWSVHAYLTNFIKK